MQGWYYWSMKVHGRIPGRRQGFPALLSLLLALLWSLPPFANAASIIELEIEGPIGVATADYVDAGIKHAVERDADLIVINIDTPGGLVKPMRTIVQSILASPIPVAVYVSPAGARADSAGTYILLAAHVAAMAPTTHLGAATPVPLVGGDTPDDAGADSTAMDRKVINDAVSSIRALAERYGRNADWAEKAVTEAATLTASEALENNVIDFVATDRGDLLRQLDGHQVNVANETRELTTENADVERFSPNWRLRLLGAISNPEIVVLLGLIGLYGLMYEGWNPGAIVPGVVGAICLLLAAYALQVLPVNYAGLALIIVGIVLMVAEAYAPSFGALGVGGIAAFVFGTVIMFDSDVPGFGISYAFVFGTALVFAVLLIWLLGYLFKLRRRGAVSGTEATVGAIAVAMEDFSNEGKVWLDGEAWQARTAAPVAKDQSVVVRTVDGLLLEVEPVINE